jgi:hypothetical protein
MDHELASPDFWRNLDVSSSDKPCFITIRDEREILESKNMDGTDYRAQFKRTFTDTNHLAEWIFILLEAEDSIPVWLLIKIVGKEMDVRIYDGEYPDDFFKEGNRADMLEHGQHWIFNEPEDTDNIVTSELEYAGEIIIPDDKGNETVYSQKEPGEFYGKVVECPPTIVDEPSFALLVEYRASDDSRSPEMLLLEIGDHEAGGLITYMEGNTLGLQEIDVLGG